MQSVSVGGIPKEYRKDIGRILEAVACQRTGYLFHEVISMDKYFYA
jgi:hypothetical protein